MGLDDIQHRWLEASMVTLQCPHWAPAAPAPRLSSPTVLVGASSALRSTGVFQPSPALNGWVATVRTL